MLKAEMKEKLLEISSILKGSGILVSDPVDGVRILEEDRGKCRADRYHLLQELKHLSAD